MDVIANNIANVNTVGFKGARATFADSFYQNLQGASGPDPMTGRAGTNPLQIGLGVGLGSIDNLMHQGVSQRTDNAMDVMLTGPGFFIVNSAEGNFFTRAGNINEDRLGNLHINGMQLMGWSTHANPDTGVHEVDRSSLVPLSLSGDKRNMPAEPTSIVGLAGNLGERDLDDNDQVIRTMRIYDSLGNSYSVDVQFTLHRNTSMASAGGDILTPNTYWTFAFMTRDGSTTRPALQGEQVAAWSGNDRTGEPAMLGLHAIWATQEGALAGSGGVDPDNFIPFGTIAFNSRGELIGKGSATVWPAPPAAAPTGSNMPLTSGVDRPANGLWPNLMIPGVTQRPPGVSGTAVHTWSSSNFEMLVFPRSGVDPRATFGDTNRRVMSYSPPGPGTGATVAATTPVGTISVDASELFQRNGNTTMIVEARDGNPPGVLSEISIGGDGTITGRFTNGRLRTLGQIPIANFRNPPGLQRVGNNLWVPTANSGPFDGIGQIGTMQGGALEMSNVDLANEFTEMITTQRGFQAASRTITVSDEMLQELVNLRR